MNNKDNTVPTVKPGISFKFSFKLLNKEGIAIKYNSNILRSDRCDVKKQGSHSWTAKTDSETICRETVTNDLTQFFRDIQDLEKYSFLPIADKPSEINLQLEYSTDLNSINLKNIKKLSDSLESLRKNKSAHKDLFRMMDVILGCAAILLYGPKAYLRSGTNPPLKTSMAEDYYGEHIYNEEISYNGLSNLIVLHPAGFSFLLGLARFCLQLQLNGQYKQVDKKIDLTKTKRKLKAISRKQSLNEDNEEWLFGILKKLKPFYKTPQVSSSLGSYPLNEYTWGMFKILTQESRALDAKKAVNFWNSIVQSIYGHTNYGFYKWCLQSKKRTSKFDNRKNNDWGGDSGFALTG